MDKQSIAYFEQHMGALLILKWNEEKSPLSSLHVT